MSSKKSSLGCIPWLTVAIFLGWGGYYLSGKVLGKPLKLIEGAQVIPDEAIMAGFVSTESTEWEQIAELGNAATKKIIKVRMEQWQATFDEEWEEVNYKEDIEPWIDGAMFALFTEDFKTANLDFLLVLGVKNKLKAYNFIKQIGEGKETSLKQSKYEGVKITEATSQGEVIYSALLGHRLLIAETKQVIQKAIDSHEGKASLASNKINQKMLRKKMANGDTLAQLFIPHYGNLITRTLEADNIPVSPSLSILNTIGSTMMSFGVEKQGLRLQSLTQLTTDEISQNFTPNKGKLLKNFPDSTVLILNGQGLNQIWTQTLGYLRKDPGTSQSFDLTKFAMGKATGLDFETDVFSWMDGEFALGVVPSSETLNLDLPIDMSGGIVLETTQPEKAQQTLDQLGNTLQQNFRLVQNQSEINKKQVTQLSSYGTTGGLNYGWLDKNKLLLTWGDDAFESISNSKKSSLPKNKNFRILSKKNHQSNSSHFYVDVPQIMKIAPQFLSSSTDSESQDMITVLNSISGIGSTFTMPDKKTGQQDLFVLFKDN